MGRKDATTIENLRAERDRLRDERAALRAGGGDPEAEKLRGAMSALGERMDADAILARFDLRVSLERREAANRAVLTGLEQRLAPAQRALEAEVQKRYTSSTADDRRHLAKIAAAVVRGLEDLDACRVGLEQEHGVQIRDVGLGRSLPRARTVAFEMTEAPRAEAALDQEAQQRARAAGLGPRSPQGLTRNSVNKNRRAPHAFGPRAVVTRDGVVVLDENSTDEEWRAALRANRLYGAPAA